MEEVSERQEQRDQCLETAKESQEASAQAAEGPDPNDSESKALEAADLAEQAFKEQNPADEMHRDAVNEAIEDALEALTKLPEETPEVKDAKDRLENLQKKQLQNEVAQDQEWAVWNLEERTWVLASNGSVIKFDTDREARDWLNARGGVI